MTKRKPRQFCRVGLAILLFLGLLTWGCLAKDEVARKEPGAEAPRIPSKVFKAAAVGDIMMGTENLLPPDGGAGLFKDAAPYLKGRDLVVGNLEGPLTDRGEPTKTAVAGRSYCFRTPPSYGRLLKEAGFTAMSLANNHANDYGPEGRAQTVEVLESLGIRHAGAPGQVAAFEAGGRKVAFLALAPNRGCQNINDIPGAVALVKSALKEDPRRLVVVSFHGGAEGADHMVLPLGPEVYLGEDRGDLIKLARALIDAGAAAVIGHGPHVPRAVEVYKDRLIAYSLGNFATAAGINVQGATGLAPLLLFDLDEEGRLVDHQIVSFRQVMNKGPRLDRGGEAAKVVEELSVRLAEELSGK
jgi:hypothetical protein